MSPRRRLAALCPSLLQAGLLAGLLLAAPGCSHDYTLEDRLTPVHVWLTAPDLAASGGSVNALVYVGGQKAVEGPITFQAGKPSVVLPSVQVRAGPVPISVVLFDGTVTATESAEIEKESWVQIVLRGKTATIRVTEEQPSPRGR